MFPIKYIDNNLVWNKDNEVFAYYELIPYNYSFLSAEQKFIVHDSFRQLIAQSREGLPKVAGNYEGMVRGLIKKYNKYHTDKLPNITPHSFRHTYCTNMANRGMNPNTLQYLMGHANITMTLGYYAHGTFQSAKAELERLAC